MTNTKHKINFSIALIWLFAIFGIIGILSSEYSKWFLSLTPLHLFLLFGALIVNIKELNIKTILALSIPFFLGFITEALGVNFGLIFGTYIYGENLGYKVFGVPLMICVNWAILTAATADVAKYFAKHIIVSSFIGAALMTGLDFAIEISAPRFDFWEFDNGLVPLQNYVGWFVTAFVAHLGYQYFKIKTNTKISWHILLSITVFFTAFLFF
jgi:putative membrane protein